MKMINLGNGDKRKCRNFNYIYLLSYYLIVSIIHCAQIQKSSGKVFFFTGLKQDTWYSQARIL